MSKDELSQLLLAAVAAEKRAERLRDDQATEAAEAARAAWDYARAKHLQAYFKALSQTFSGRQ